MLLDVCALRQPKLVNGLCASPVLIARQNRSRLFFVHFLMLAVIFTKFCSLCFKGLDYHFIKVGYTPLAAGVVYKCH